MSTATVRENQQPWWSVVTFDLLLTVARRTILHPFVAWMIPLSLRAQATPYHHLSFQISTSYALLLTIIYMLSVLNRRIAHGSPRSVDLSEEVVVITGGASGLGLLIADFYAMRGASVAVLDVKPKSTLQESKGIAYYLCDVGDCEQVHNSANKIKEDVRGNACRTVKLLIYAKAWYAYHPSKQCRDCYRKVNVGIDTFGGRKV